MQQRQPEDDYDPPHDRERIAFGVTVALLAAGLWLASHLHKEVAMRRRFSAGRSIVRAKRAQRSNRSNSWFTLRRAGSRVLHIAVGDNVAKSWSS
jgi:hypothetical protein